MEYDSYMSSGGYYCGYCGAYVPPNTMHFCYPYEGCYLPRYDMKTVIDKLDEIIKLLKEKKKVT